jgi:hypothetical protein
MGEGSVFGRRDVPDFVRVYHCLGCRFPRAVGFSEAELDRALPHSLMPANEGECFGCGEERGFGLADWERG